MQKKFAKELRDEAKIFGVDEQEREFLNDMASRIMYATDTADVATVVHAHWIYRSDAGITKCSHCGWDIEDWVDDKYCRECGAKMDEYERENEIE